MLFAAMLAIRRPWSALLGHGLLGACCLCLSAWTHAQTDPMETAERLWQQGAGAAVTATPPATPAADATPTTWALDAHTRLRQLFFEVLAAIEQQNWFGADRLLRQYTSIPEHDPALFDFVAASRAAAQGDYDAAIAHYETVLSTNPDFLRAQLDLLQARYGARRLREAQRQLDTLQAQPQSPPVTQFLQRYEAILAATQRLSGTLTLAWVHDSNLNQASTVVDPCALRLGQRCLPNRPGQPRASGGYTFELTASKRWPLSGRHNLLWRSVNYGSRYPQTRRDDQLVATQYFGYHYESAQLQAQVLPLLDYQQEGGRRLQHAPGLRSSLRYQPRANLAFELSHEYRRRYLAPRLRPLQGGLRRLSLQSTYAANAATLLYANLGWQAQDTERRSFAYRDLTARIGVQHRLNEHITLHASYAHRRRHSPEPHIGFGLRQQDRENSLYLHLSLPGYRIAWLTPTLSYDYRRNRSTIAHAYSYQRQRITLGLSTTF